MKRVGRKVLGGLMALALLGGAGSLPVSAVSADELTAKAAVLMEEGTGQVLFQKNAHEARPIASVTKVMTLLLIMEEIDSGRLSLTDTVTASAHAAGMGGSDIWLKEGETMTVDDMLKAVVIMSANDAAVALGEKIAGSEEAFVQRMNERAKELGMNDTVFKNCCGLDEEGHVSSAYDVALMSRELIRHETIFRYTTTWMDSVRDGATQLVNTNRLIRTYTGITGLKTGTTSQAGSCITATAQRDGMTLIAVVLGAETSALRFSEAATLLDTGFAGWSTVQPEIADVGSLPVTGGMESEVALKVEACPPLLIEKGRDEELKQTVNLPESIPAPVDTKTILGSVTITLGETELVSLPVYAAREIEAVSWDKIFFLLLENLGTF
ncbi:MAG TPA: D-alanyl-D-alanine carboxypeptidase [Firmicutes bacterium]|nr:D-alanyl-D-alanine carboxypeptidase [Bacillota bacterium]